MKKSILATAFISLSLFFWKCDLAQDDFLLKGKISNLKRANVVLKPVYNEIYYLPKTQTDSTELIDEKFQFQLQNFEIPQPYYLEIDGIPTDKFILETGKLSLTIDSLYPRVKPEIKGLTHNLHMDSLLYSQKTKLLNQWFNKSYDSIKSLGLDNLDFESAMMQLRENMTKKSNRQLLHFVQNHPNSYYAFWELVSALQWNDYFPEYEQTLSEFSLKIKKSYAVSMFEKKLLEAKKRSVGNLFPVVSVRDSLSQEIKIDFKNKKPNRYTLIDFWFSGCQPCIAQFPEYTILYKTYHSSGFEIISISTDQNEYVDLWKSMIRKHHLRWPNYIDHNFDATARMNITKYPTNFLIDSTAKIIAKDLSLRELKTLLESNIIRH